MAGEKKTFSFLWLAYGQIASAIAALSLLVFVGHFFDVGLKGVVRDAVHWWIENIRPVVGYPLQWIVNNLPQDWRFEMPALWKDYLAVGFVMMLSYLRANRDEVASGESPAGQVLIALITIFAWPIATFGNLIPAAVNFLRGTDRDFFPFVVLWLTPLLYLGVILALNALL